MFGPSGGSRRVALTGAFGFTGRSLAERLVKAGPSVVTLSRRSGAGDPLAERLAVRRLDFRRPDELSASLEGVDTLYNTYWMRFPGDRGTFDEAVEDSATLFGAAERAGVRRIVHISVVGARPDAATPYVRAKAQVEALLRTSSLEWAIVRPTLTVGPNDILINNLAWALRRLPIYGMPGFGRYRVQPVHVDDVARICVEAGEGPAGVVLDAAGPETFAYRELVDLVRRAVRSRALVLPMPRLAVLAASAMLGAVVGDRVLTSDEVDELTSSLLTSTEPARGQIRVSDWIAANGSLLGRRWASELQRNYRVPAW